MEADTAKYSGRAMAVHEAGHAVAGLDVGLKLDYVMLGRADDVAGTQLFSPRGGGWYLPPEFCNEQVHRAAMARSPRCEAERSPATDRVARGPARRACALGAGEVPDTRHSCVPPTVRTRVGARCCVVEPVRRSG
jgi:hypothetical protein